MFTILSAVCSALRRCENILHLDTNTHIVKGLHALQETAVPNYINHTSLSMMSEIVTSVFI